jgi:hypothetical protein
MSNTYFICKGNYYYIADRTSGEGFSFSNFGRSVEKIPADYALSLGGNVEKADVISILYDVNSDICELYLNGSKKLIKKKGMSAFATLKNHVKLLTYIPFRVIRDDCQGLNQLLLPVEEGSINFNEVLQLIN